MGADLSEANADDVGCDYVQGSYPSHLKATLGATKTCTRPRLAIRQLRIAPFDFLELYELFIRSSLLPMPAVG